MATEKFYTGKCSEQCIKEKLYLSTYVVGRSAHVFRLDEKLSVFFIDEDRDICRQIVDKWGNIRNFPGIIYGEQFVEEYGKYEVEPVVRYDTRFARCADSGEKTRFLMVWTVRPDGRYWEDSWGFGAEDYESVCLYSIIDHNGDFIQPFKLHSIGSKYFGEYKF